MEERKPTLWNRIKALPPIVFIAVALVVLGSGLVMAQMTVSRHTIVDRTGDMTVSGDQPLHLYGDDLEGAVTYTVTNTGPTTYTVTASATTTTGLLCSIDPITFVLGPGASKDFTFTLTFVDPSYTTGDCWPSFTHN